MKYYLMMTSQDQLQNGVLAQIAENTDWDELPWLEGNEIKEYVREPLQYNLCIANGRKNFDFEKNDYFESDLGQPIVSSRLREILQKISPEIQVYSAQLYYNQALLSNNYFALNITSSFECMNRDDSEYSKSNLTGEEVILSVKKLYLKKENIEKVPQSIFLFRLKECTSYIIISEAGKARIEKENIVGIQFKELQSTP